MHITAVIVAKTTRRYCTYMRFDHATVRRVLAKVQPCQVKHGTLPKIPDVELFSPPISRLTQLPLQLTLLGF